MRHNLSLAIAPHLLSMFKRTFLFIGLGAALGIVSVGVWFFFGDAIQERMHRQRFDPVAWQAQKGFADDIRIRMVDDLLSNQDFHGMTRDALTAIVGEPNGDGYFEEWDLVYWLGPERGFMSIDSEWLVFRLDSQERVSDYRIVRD